MELGPNSGAPGELIVVEAKQQKDYSLDKARDELEEAIKNRKAAIGLCVSAVSTSDKLKRFNNLVNKTVVVWDPEDSATNVVLDAGLSVAVALSIRAKSHSVQVGPSIDAIETAIGTIEKQVEVLEEIEKSSETIIKNGENVQKNAGRIRETLNEQIYILNVQVDALSRAQEA